MKKMRSVEQQDPRNVMRSIMRSCLPDHVGEVPEGDIIRNMATVNDSCKHTVSGNEQTQCPPVCCTIEM